jgi:hypothetical protein
MTTAVPRHAWIPLDTRLSYAARGLLGEIASYGPDWNPETPAATAARAAGDRGQAAEDPAALGAVYAELTAAGYLTRQHGGRYRLVAGRERVMRAAQLGAEHLGRCDPPLNRDEQRAWITAIDGVLLRSRHDPATVAAVLAEVRDRRAAGQQTDPSLLESAVNRVVRAAAADTDRYATLCLSCLNFHEDGAACLFWEGR